MAEKNTRLFHIAAAMACFTPSFASHADAAFLTGSATMHNVDWPVTHLVGDGINHVEFVASFATYAQWDAGVWLYGQDGWPTNEHTRVALVEGISDPSSITDASTLQYHNDYSPDPLGAVAWEPHFIWPDDPDDWKNLPRESVSGIAVLHNQESGHYGAVRIDYAYNWQAPVQWETFDIDFTWWFLTDGGSDFSIIPAPGSFLALGLGLLAVRRRRTN